jgi:uncharacterized short protein YbdD (DUF466 family)
MMRVDHPFKRIATLVKRIAGMPDYERYVAHMRTHHAECPVPSEREFYAMFLKGRYEGGANRCC